MTPSKVSNLRSQETGGPGDFRGVFGGKNYHKERKESDLRSGVEIQLQEHP